jgi:hypothetical protein
MMTLTLIWKRVNPASLTALLVFVLVICSVFIIGRWEAPPAVSAPSPTESLYTCIGSTIKALGKVNFDFNGYNQIWELCGQQLQALDSLRDYDVRKEKFEKQESEETIILFMVVIITLSGICLAAFQLWAAYKMTTAGIGEEFSKESSIAMEYNKISVKSSTTGLLILVVSLAFFFIYVRWVYAIQEFKATAPNDFNLGAAPSPEPAPNATVGNPAPSKMQ